MTSLELSSGLESGMVRCSPAQLMLRNRLGRGHVWLNDLFGESSLPFVDVGIGAGDGPPEFSWRLLIAGPTGVLMQVGITDMLIDALGLSRRGPESLWQALAAQWAAPFMPALRTFFEQEVEPRLERAPNGWPDTEGWPKFHFTIATLRQTLPGRVVDAFALKLAEKATRSQRRRDAHLQMPLFAGRQLRLSPGEVRRLKRGDVLLCDGTATGEAPQTRLYVESSAPPHPWRYLATVRTDDGRVDHLSPGAWHDSHGAACGQPRVHVDIVQARLQLPVDRCRALAVGQCIEGWQQATWLSEAELRIGRRPLARARPLRLVGRDGFEIIQVQAPVASQRGPAC